MEPGAILSLFNLFIILGLIALFIIVLTVDNEVHERRNRKRQSSRAAGKTEVIPAGNDPVPHAA